jgi:hypothetical protein
MSTVPIPAILKGWVAEPGQHTTGVTDPVVIDHTAIEDLAFYHPGFDSSTPHRFRHVADSDDEGPFARCDDAFSHNWHEKMQEVMAKLKLRPQVEFGHPCLIDSAIAKVPTRLMHGWRVVHWKVVKSRDLKMQVVHQDFIRWQDASGRLVESMFTWRPYAALEEQPVTQDLTPNERRVLREILRR